MADGWTVERGDPGRDAPALLAEHDLRLDLTALRRLRALQLGLIAEFAASIVFGFFWPTLGHPGWQGELITALAAIGAVGLVVWLARVDFVSEVLIVSRSRPIGGDSGDRKPAGRSGGYRVAAARVLSRNWEVLGDRGGRKVVASRSTPGSAAAATNARERLEPHGGPTANPSSPGPTTKAYSPMTDPQTDPNSAGPTTSDFGPPTSPPDRTGVEQP